MQTLLQLLETTTAFFNEHGVESARLNAERIFAHVLRCKRLDLYLQHERPLNAAQLDALRPLVARRARREPLQYVLGSTEFLGLELKCDSRALIPRPETEELAEHLSERLRSQAPANLLDLGTGTGALALTLAAAFPEARVVAVDEAAEALDLARENAVANGLEKRVEFRLGHWWYPLQADERFDLIVANPPYLTNTEWQSALPEVQQHEPESALWPGDPEGLADLQEILNGSPQHLAPGGLLALETGIAQHDALQVLARERGLTDLESRSDLQGRPRFLFARKPAS
ncbi:MAG: peptide chain release factor N(5)-glutamine methyltransferase [Opitutales bacterium]